MDRPVKSEGLLKKIEQRIFLIPGQNVMLACHDVASAKAGCRLG
jgi:hypothetical protein